MLQASLRLRPRQWRWSAIWSERCQATKLWEDEPESDWRDLNQSVPTFCSQYELCKVTHFRWEAPLRSCGKRRRTQQFRHPNVFLSMYSESMGEILRQIWNAALELSHIGSRCVSAAHTQKEKKRKSGLVHFSRYSERLRCTGTVRWWCLW